MSFKLVANAQAGRYPRGAVITDPEEIARLMGGNLRRRFIKVPIAPGDQPHAPSPPANQGDRAE